MIRLRSVIALPLLAGCLAVSGCSSDPGPPPDLATTLHDDTGTAWAVYVSDASHEVRFLAPVTPVRIGSGTNEADARGFFDRYKTKLHGTGDGDELRLLETVIADDGTTHLRFEHFVPGTNLPVFDVTSTAHFLPTGEAYWLRPGFRADLAGIATSPKISVADATTIAVAHLAIACGASNGAPSIDGVELGIRADEGEPAALAYRVHASVESAGCIAPEVLIDAVTADVRALHERARSAWDDAPGARFYLLADPTDIKRIDVKDPTFGDKSMISSVSPSVETLALNHKAKRTLDRIEKVDGQWDPEEKDYRGVAVSAHFWGFHTLRFFKEAKLTTCLDQKLVIHDRSDRTDDGTNAMNDRGTVYLGDGDVLAGKNQMPAAAAFDVVAHEITHGITQRTSKLAGENQPGALDESFSDVMGASAEQWFNETNDVKNPKMKNLVFGEAWTKDGSGKRDMVDPGSKGHPDQKRTDADPDHTTKNVGCAPGEAASKANDFCFIHRNAGIPNRAFSLMTIGGTNKTSQISVAKGIGWETARSIWFTSITSLSAQSTFVEAALAQLAEAGKRLDPGLLQAVGCAWVAVGVFDVAAPVDPRIALLGCPKGNGPASGPPPAKLTGSTPTTCAGRGDAIVCDESAPASASVCKNGGIVATALCADLAQHCKKAGANDWTGSLDSGGALVCE